MFCGRQINKEHIVAYAAKSCASCYFLNSGGSMPRCILVLLGGDKGKHNQILSSLD